MRIAMLASGTRGDVQPMVAIGDELARRGHEVVVAVNSDLADWVTRAGLRAVPTGVDFKRFLNSAESRRMLAHGKVDTTIRRIVADEHRVNQQIVNACVRAAENADVILTTVTMSLRGLCLEKATGVPSRILYSFPILPTGDFSGIMPRVRDFRMAWANRGGSRLLNQLYWMRNKANLDEMSDLMGAPRVSRMPRQEERPGLHLYSPRVVPEPSDLPGGHELIGFPVLSDGLRDRLGERTVPAELDRWLDAGPEPVYFGFGSMPVLDPERTLRELIDVTARRGIRGLVGAGWSELGRYADGLPDHLFLARSEFDHDRVLPRCRAAVHHGGAGTTAAALRAGLPSVVASFFADQPFWGWRTEQLRVGTALPFRGLTPARLGRALDRVLDPAYRTRARAVGADLRREDPASRAGDVIEQWLSPRRPQVKGIS
ncbi:glycosyltransferase [Actinomadura kijaniata]|uniref:glycosyltransferase n=1 Tax=Actinomadura kijaniata TaxID=46161 RepID=UPI0008365302|nr:glycosyltransferase [Actinomadura kijaniata]